MTLDEMRDLALYLRQRDSLTIDSAVRMATIGSSSKIKNKVKRKVVKVLEAREREGAS